MKEKIMAMIAEQLGISPADVSEEKRLVEDLHADSLDLFQMLMTMENEFEIEFEDDEIEALKTVGEAITFIQNKLGK